MNYRNYLRNSVWDFFLCLPVLCSFVLAVSSGFYIDKSLQYGYGLLIGGSAVLLLLFFLGAYNKRSILLCLFGILLLVVLFLVVARQMGGGAVFRDREDNPYFYGVLLFLSAVGVFLLSRSKIGAGVLFSVGSLILIAIQFLYRSNHLFPLFVFLLGSGTLFLYRTYQRNILRSETVKPAFGKAFCAGLLLCLLALGLATGLYYGVTRVYQPPALELKLITKYLALRTIDKVGIADLNKIPDPTKKTSNTNDQTKDRGKDDQKQKEQRELEQQKQEKSLNKNTPEHPDNSPNPFFRFITWIKEGHRWIWLILLLPTAVGAAVFTKLRLRRKWYKDLERLEPAHRIKTMYRFYMEKLAKMKIKRQQGDTLFEFMEKAERPLAQFGSAGDTFGDLTRIYVKTAYGGQSVTAAEVERYLRFHGTFYANCREYLGRRKYIRKFFML